MSIKISELPAGTALSGTEEIPIVQSATTKKITAQDVADLATPDLSGLVPYTGATADVDLGAFNLEATTLIKSGGLATQFLMADGTTSLADIIFTIELVDELSVDFYAPYNLKINTVTNVLNSPITTILDDGVSYTLTNTIAVGSMITVTVDTVSVVNLNIVKV